MRILIDIHDMTLTGGIERVMCGLANALSQRGHHITCFTYAPLNTPPRFSFAPEIKFIHYTATGDAATIAPLREQLLHCAPDVFVAPNSFKHILLWCAVLKGTNIPWVYSEHNNPWIIENKRWNQSERHSALWAADAIHLLLPIYLQSVPEDLRHKCHIIANPVPPATIERATNPDQPQILSLGRYSDVKQIPLLVQAFDLLAAEFPHWKLQIWGKGDQEKVIRKAIDRTACRERICLHGLAHEPEQQFSTADIFCIPSRFEGFPLTIGEAFTHGVPVVGFQDCSGVNSLVVSGQNGLLAPEMTASCLAQSLRQLMQDTALRQYMGTTAQEHAKAFAPAHIYDQWETMLIQTASRKGKTQLARLRAINAAKERKKEQLHISAEEKIWMNTIQEVISRPNVLLQNKQIFRRFIRRHPKLKAALKAILKTMTE